MAINPKETAAQIIAYCSPLQARCRQRVCAWRAVDYNGREFSPESRRVK
jgi:hypothetical protein